MTFEEFKTYVSRLGNCPPGMRRGQFIFNYLYMVRPDLANRIRGTRLDPFYREDGFSETMGWLHDHWSLPPGYDPTTAIGSIRAYVGIILEPSNPDDTDTFETAARLLAQQVRTLDQWLKDGGSAPEDWGVM